MHKTFFRDVEKQTTQEVSPVAYFQHRPVTLVKIHMLSINKLARGINIGNNLVQPWGIITNETNLLWSGSIDLFREQNICLSFSGSIKIY